MMHRFRLLSGLAVLIAATCAVMALPVRAEPKLPSIASLDHCADQYVLALADKSQISALSHRATKDYSFYRDRAIGLPMSKGTIEEIIFLRPDVVVRYWGGSARLREFLKQAGIPVISAERGLKTEDVLRNVTIFSQAFDRGEAGEAFIKNYRARLKNLQRQAPGKLRAVYLSPGGTSAGVGTFGDEIIKLAGLRNAVAEMGLKGWTTLPLEALVMDPPDVIIGAFFDSTSIQRSDWGLLRHPVVQRLFHDTPTIFVPGRLLACRAFTFIDAAEFVVKHLKEIQSAPNKASKAS